MSKLELLSQPLKPLLLTVSNYNNLACWLIIRQVNVNYASSFGISRIISFVSHSCEYLTPGTCIHFDGKVYRLVLKINTREIAT
jgi:hypothetical protein